MIIIYRKEMKKASNPIVRVNKNSWPSESIYAYVMLVVDKP